MTSETPRFSPYREPLHATLARNGIIAIVCATVITLVVGRRHAAAPGGLRVWLGWFAFALWIALGGHYVKIGYLNGVRMRCRAWSQARAAPLRLIVWLAGGSALFACAAASRRLVTLRSFPPLAHLAAPLLYGGIAFVVIEMVVHAVLALRGRGSFWSGTG